MIVDANGNRTNTFVADVPGVYGITGYRYGQATGAAQFHADAQGTSAKRLELVETANVTVCAKLLLPITSLSGHGLTLQLGVTGSTIQTATLVSPIDDVSRQSILDPTVAAAVTATLGGLISLFGPSLVAATEELHTIYNAHRVFGPSSVHVAADTINVEARDAVTDVVGAISMLNDLRVRMLGHLTGSSSAAARWHTVDDSKNLPQAALAKDVATATVLLCDLRRRVYERHRAQIATPNTHGLADSTNVLAAATPLETLLTAFFDFVASASPAAPTGENAGSLSAQARYGFRVTT